MDKQLRESLIFMSDHCPSEIGLKECEKIEDDNGFPTCENNCLKCWVDSLRLSSDLVNELL